MAQNTTRRLKIVAGADSFGGSLKDSLVNHLRSLNIDVEDLGTSDKYYSVGEEIGRRVATSTSDDAETRGLVACGTGVGVSIFANKFPGVYAATCLTPGDALNSRSVNNSNVLAVSGMSTSPASAVEILDAWLNTPFKSPCPASDSKPWPTEIDSFLENSISEMSKIGEGGPEPKNKDTSSSCAICWLNSRNKDKPEGDFTPIEMMRGGSMKLLRETPTSAVVRFESGSVEPAHHHTFGHDLVVMKGKKKVWNLSKKEEYDLGVGDYLFTPAGDVHRVKYWEDTEFFIKWDGHWDVFMDEDLDAANAAIASTRSLPPLVPSTNGQKWKSQHIYAGSRRINNSDHENTEVNQYQRPPQTKFSSIVQCGPDHCGSIPKVTNSDRAVHIVYIAKKYVLAKN